MLHLQIKHLAKQDLIYSIICHSIYKCVKNNVSLLNLDIEKTPFRNFFMQLVAITDLAFFYNACGPVATRWLQTIRFINLFIFVMLSVITAR